MSSTSCTESGCRNQPLFNCTCLKYRYACQLHIIEHLASYGSHESESLVSIVPEDKKLKIFNYLIFKKELVRKNLNSLIQFSNQLIKFITDQTKKLQNKLLIEQNNLNYFLKTFNKNFNGK